MTLRVTDHAVLRYLERVHGIDVEFFRDHLRNRIQRAHDAMVKAGLADVDSAITFPEGKYIIRQSVLVTVYGPAYNIGGHISTFAAAAEASDA